MWIWGRLWRHFFLEKSGIISLKVLKKVLDKSCKNTISWAKQATETQLKTNKTWFMCKILITKLWLNVYKMDDLPFRSVHCLCTDKCICIFKKLIWSVQTSCAQSLLFAQSFWGQRSNTGQDVSVAASCCDHTTLRKICVLFFFFFFSLFLRPAQTGCGIRVEVEVEVKDVTST